MSLPLDFVPRKPFPGFKWKWASVQCTEGLNDPVVLLGVLFRMRRLELQNRGIKFSSDEFSDELRALARDVEGRGIEVDLARRTGSRNLMRNSGQYWKAVGLVPSESTDGKIVLTPFGRLVADRKISQTEFAAITVQTFSLPNCAVQKPEECEQWRMAQLSFKPLLILLQVIRALDAEAGMGYLTKQELLRVVVPLSGEKNATVDDFVAFVRAFRLGRLDVSSWPNCCTDSNDHRIAREFLLFLSNYGYLVQQEVDGDERFVYNRVLDEEISKLVAMTAMGGYAEWLERIKREEIAPEIERKRASTTRDRPNQARFRREVLGDSPRCVITNVAMPEVLEAAHIIPFKYHGEDTRANGLSMRMDIHQLFDTGHLRIAPSGGVFLSDRARMNYGMQIPPEIHFPAWVNRDFIRWRWENYNGL